MKDKIHAFNLRLMAVHRYLLDGARADIERRESRKISPLELYNLLLKDESLQWLKPLSTFIADTDALTDKRYELHEHDVPKLKVRFASVLLAPAVSDGHAGLAARYQSQLQTDSDLALLHAQLLAAFEQL